jgi:phosphate transport system substrate-binding protein
MRRTMLMVAVIALGVAGLACNTGSGGGGDGLSGEVQIDGSSTVAPISQALAEAFGEDESGVNVAVGTSGTGGGFEKFCRGDIDISDASRPIEDDEEEACAKEGVGYVELKVATDGLSVVVNKENDFVQCLTIEELKKIWEPNSTVKTWKDVKAEWPADEIQLYGPGADSGTFDYFTDVIVGEEGASRKDYTQSENDNQLVNGVAGEGSALGYFGYAYYIENDDKLTAVAVDSGDGCVEPTTETIGDGTYAPLSRPIFIYPSTASLGEEHIATFVEFYLDNVNDVLADVGYIELPAEDLQASKDALAEAIAG